MPSYITGANASLNGNVTTTVTTGGVDTTGADLIWAFVGVYAGGGGAPSFSDSKGNTWTALTLRSGGAGQAGRMYYCFNPTVGSGHTFTGGNAIPHVEVLAFNCGFGADPFDQQASNDNSSSSTIQPGSLTPATAANIVCCGLSVWQNSSGADGSVNGGFTEPLADTTGTTLTVTAGYLIQSAATAANPTWTASGGGGAFALLTGMAVFKAAAAGSPVGRILTVNQAVRRASRW